MEHVIEHRRPLGLAGRDAPIHVDLLDAFELVGSPFGQQTGAAGAGAQTDDGGHAPLPGLLVELQHVEGGFRIVAVVHVVPAGLDGRAQHLESKQVMGARAVVHHVHILHGVLHTPVIEGVELDGAEPGGTPIAHQPLRELEIDVAEDDRIEDAAIEEQIDSGLCLSSAATEHRESCHSHPPLVRSGQL
ncbi:MAG: hypothetical protein QNK04_32125 [Myxococcota bacterium]|nr:hypothetical protein [Myxococcota bacterium]